MIIPSLATSRPDGSTTSPATMVVVVIMPVLVRMGVRMGVRVRMLALIVMRVSVHLHEIFAPDAELRGADARACHAFRPHRIRVNGEAAERPADIRERHTGVDEGAQYHVA